MLKEPLGIYVVAAQLMCKVVLEHALGVALKQTLKIHADCFL
jgi:hypothetical protein